MDAKLVQMVYGLSGLALFACLIITLVMRGLEEGAMPPWWQDERQRLARALRFLAPLAALVGAGWASLALLKQTPFAPGQSLAIGFLAGLASSLLWLLITSWAVPVGATGAASAPVLRFGWQSGLLALAALGWGSLSQGATLFFSPPEPVTALLGMLAGTGLVVFVAGTPLRLTTSVASAPLRPGTLVSGLLEWYLLSTALLTLSAALAWLRRDGESGVPSHLMPVAVTLLAGGLSLPLLRWPAVHFVALVGLAAGGFLIAAARWMGEPTIGILFMSGAVSGLLILRVARLARDQPLSADPTPERISAGIQLALLVGLLLTGLVAVGFVLHHGLGVAVAGLGLLVPALWEQNHYLMRARESWRSSEEDPASATPPVLPGVLLFLVLFLLFRIYYERNPLAGYRADLYLHSTFMGLLGAVLLGAVLGLLAWQAARRLQETTGTAQAALPVTVWLDWLFTGGLLGLTPALVLLFWGARGGAGTVGGIALSGWLLMLASLSSWGLAPVTAAAAALQAAWSEPLRVLMLLAALVAVQFSALAAQGAAWDKERKLIVMVGVAAAGLVIGYLRVQISRSTAPPGWAEPLSRPNLPEPPAR